MWSLTNLKELWTCECVIKTLKYHLGLCKCLVNAKFTPLVPIHYTEVYLPEALRPVLPSQDSCPASDHFPPAPEKLQLALGFIENIITTYN